MFRSGCTILPAFTAAYDAVETIGMDKAIHHLETADITLLVFDGSRALDSHDRLLLAKKQDRNCLALINKADLAQRIDAEELKTLF